MNGGEEMSNSFDPNEACQRYSWAMSCGTDSHTTFEQWKTGREKERQEQELARQAQLSQQKMARGHCDWEKEQNPLAQRQLFAHQANLERSCFPRYRCYYAVNLERGKRIASRYPYPSWTQRHPYTPFDGSGRSGDDEERGDKGLEVEAVSGREEVVEAWREAGPVKRSSNHECDHKYFSVPSFTQQASMTSNDMEPESLFKEFKGTSKLNAVDIDHQLMTKVKDLQAPKGPRTKWRRLKRGKKCTKRALLYLLKLTRFTWSQKRNVG